MKKDCFAEHYCYCREVVCCYYLKILELTFETGLLIRIVERWMAEVKKISMFVRKTVVMKDLKEGEVFWKIVIA